MAVLEEKKKFPRRKSKLCGFCNTLCASSRKRTKHANRCKGK